MRFMVIVKTTKSSEAGSLLGSVEQSRARRDRDYRRLLLRRRDSLSATVLFQSIVREHAKLGGFPADRISKVRTITDPDDRRSVITVFPQGAKTASRQGRAARCGFFALRCSCQKPDFRNSIIS